MPFTRDQFEPDEGEAGVHFDGFINALTTWCAMQGIVPKVSQAAAAFNTSNEIVAEAVNKSMWMLLFAVAAVPLGEQTIELDGE